MYYKLEASAGGLCCFVFFFMQLSRELTDGVWLPAIYWCNRIKWDNKTSNLETTVKIESVYKSFTDISKLPQQCLDSRLIIHFIAFSH